VVGSSESRSIYFAGQIVDPVALLDFEEYLFLNDLKIIEKFAGV